MHAAPFTVQPGVGGCRCPTHRENAQSEQTTADPDRFAVLLARQRGEAHATHHGRGRDSPPAATGSPLSLPDLATSPEEIRAGLGAKITHFARRLESLLNLAGVEPGWTVRLRGRSDGGIQLMDRTPYHGRIQEAIDNDPELQGLFNQVTASAGLLQAAQEAITFQEAYRENPQQALARYGHLFTGQPRMVVVTVLWGSGASVARDGENLLTIRHNEGAAATGDTTESASAVDDTTEAAAAGDDPGEAEAAADAALLDDPPGPWHRGYPGVGHRHTHGTTDSASTTASAATTTGAAATATTTDPPTSATQDPEETPVGHLLAARVASLPMGRMARGAMTPAEWALLERARGAAHTGRWGGGTVGEGRGGQRTLHAEHAGAHEGHAFRPVAARQAPARASAHRHGGASPPVLDRESLTALRDELLAHNRGARMLARVEAALAVTGEQAEGASATGEGGEATAQT